MKFKLRYFIPLLYVCGFLSCADIARTRSTDGENEITFEDLKTNFIKPSKEYSSVPFMTWNGEVTKEKIDSQLQSLHNQGFGGVIIRPRWGMITEYLNDNWNELVRYTVAKGKSLDMKVWLSDEFSHPSGYAGGHVPVAMPESFDVKQGIIMHKAKKLSSIVRENYAFVMRRNGNLFEDITANLEQYVGVPGDYYLFKWFTKYQDEDKRFGGYNYVDLIAPGVTKKFIEATMTGYEQSFGEEFGETVPGIFTFEPNIAPRNPNAIRYTAELFELFEIIYHYSLKENLPCLFENVGKYKKVRHDYYSLLSGLFIHKWAMPWQTYCNEHNLKWSGHYWEHDWPNPRYTPDVMSMYSYHHEPSIDLMFNHFREDVNAQYGNVRMVKEMCSVANQFGLAKKHANVFGGAGWDVDFKTIKRNVDWVFAMGVNTINQYHSYMDMNGDRKYDFPLSFSYHNPWWESYAELNNYFNRLSYVLSQGQQNNNVLVLEPTSTGWLYALAGNTISDQSSKNNVRTGSSFQQFVVQSAKEHIEFDLGNENILNQHGSVVDGQLRVNKSLYKLIVIPPGMENLELSTYKLLDKYLESGGVLLLATNSPTYINGDVTDAIAQMFIEYKEQIYQTKTIEESVDLMRKFCPNYQLIESKNPTAPALYHIRRSISDGEIIFLANADKQDSVINQIKVTGKSVYQMDAYSGEITKYPFKRDDGEVTIDVKLPPVGSLLLFVSAQKSSSPKLKENVIAEKITPFSGISAKPNQPNVLTLDYCDLIVDNDRVGEYFFYNASAVAYKYHGFEGNPWSMGVQYKSNILDKNSFQSGTGFRATYYFEINDEFTSFNSLKAVVELPTIFTVKVNGKTVLPNKDEWWLDKEFGVYSIGDYSKKGLNSISISVDPMHILAEIQPVYILGNFSLQAKSKGFEISPFLKIKHGSWKEQGMPFYGHSVSYTQVYDFEKNRNYLFRSGQWDGVVAKLYVNEEYVTLLYSDKDEVNISDYVVKGKNIIKVEVIGSLRNVIGPFHFIGDDKISNHFRWRYAPATKPSGEKYQVADYGLLTPFSIWEFTEE